MKLAAIYVRVAAIQQSGKRTIESQTAALVELARRNEFEVKKDWICEDEGYSGTTLERPGLERVRNLAACGQIQAVLVYEPSRLSRTYAHQSLLIEEFARRGVDTLFATAPDGKAPDGQWRTLPHGYIAE